MGSSYQAQHSTEIFGMARIIRAWHGNIWHGTDPPDPYGTDPPDPGTARDIPVLGHVSKSRKAFVGEH